MSSTKYASPLTIEVRRSRQLLALLLFAHIGALLLIWALSISLWLILLIALLIVTSLLYSVKRHYLRNSHNAIVHAVWDADENWHLSLANGSTVIARLLPDTYIHPWLVVLNFVSQNPSKKYSLLLLPDSLDASTLRRLRVRLRTSSPDAKNPEM